MLSNVVALVATGCCGLVAGVFLAVAVSVVPALSDLPAQSYIELHLRLGKGYHPIMPLVVMVSLLADCWLVAITGGAARLLAVAAVVCVLGVQAVSHLRNEQLNRKVRAVAGGPLTDWRDPRSAWRAWHHARLVLAVAALAVNAATLPLLR